MKNIPILSKEQINKMQLDDKQYAIKLVSKYFSQVIPKDYKRASTNKEIQSISSEMCGQLCCLWLYYINYKSNNSYYKINKLSLITLIKGL